MEEFIDLIATDASPSEITNKVKEILYSKAAEKIEMARPMVSSILFSDNESEENEDEG